MTLYQKIKRIARPVVQHYHTDLTVHDRRTLRTMKLGEIAMWSCRTHGTHFIWLSRKDDKADHATVESCRNALNYFDAVAKVFGNEDGSDQWYLLEKTGDGVIPMTAEQARGHFVRRINCISDLVKRQRSSEAAVSAWTSAYQRNTAA